MAKYSALLGKRVQVRYRAGEVYLPASGKLAADTGKSIFLEEHFDKNGRMVTYRWEIPYPCIVHVTEIDAESGTAASGVVESKTERVARKERFLRFGGRETA